MLAPLHAYYMILQAFTVDFMQIQALHASSVGPSYFEIGLNLMFVATSSILSPLSYDMSARSHPAMYSANDLEKLAGPSMRSARPLPPSESQTRKSFRGSGSAARGTLARQAAAALLYASGPACRAAHNFA